MITDPQTGDAYRVIDVHQHLGSREDVNALGERVELLDAYGIDQAILLPPSGAFGAGEDGTAALNERVAQAVQAWPQRFACGVAHLSLADGQEECLRQIDVASHELGLRGVVWHHRFQGMYLDHPAMPALLARCGDAGIPALIHVIAGSSIEASWRLESLLADHPATEILALDGFSGVDRAEELISLARRFPNLSCDLGAMISVAGWLIKKFLEEVGPERLLLGTDLYMSPRTWYSPAPLLEVVHMDIEPSVKRLILSENAVRLFGLQAGV